MATQGYYIETIKPPEMLGKTVINLTVGQTKSITAAMLMNSFFPYAQEQDFPMGAIRIMGSSGDYRFGLSQSNIANVTIAALFQGSSGTTRIYRASSTSTITNRDITFAIHNAGNFKVTGIRVGTVQIYYTCKAKNSSTTDESEQYANVNGTIEIIVSSANNQKPSNVQGSITNVIHNALTMIGVNAYLTNYADPEGDAAKDVELTSLPPNGQLLLMGTPIVSSQLPLIIPITTIAAGGLMYFADSTTVIGQTYYNNFGVSDVGSGLMTY